MSNQKNSMVPRLRFPEFKDADGWQIKPISEDLSFQTGFPFDSKGFNENGIGVRLIRNRDLKFDDRIVYYSKAFDEKYLVEDGDVLVGMDGDFTPCIWNKGKALLNQRVGRILVNEPDSKYFFYYFLSLQLKSIEEATARTTVKHLSHSDIEKITGPLPGKTEQQKIASCLSSLDELITAESQKLDALKVHKKGLMQQLFPAEGETVPKLRFAEFKESGEWEEKTLRNVCQMQAGKFVSASNIYEQQNDDLYPCFGGNGLRGYTASFTHEGKFSLIGRQGALCGNVTLAEGKFHATEHAVVVTPYSNISTEWLYYILVHLDLNQYATGQAQPGLSVENLKKVEILVPDTEVEQQTIASCLSSLDEQISQQAEKIEALKLHKKGLMQQLFPSLTASDA